jgi:hypothetical protein
MKKIGLLCLALVLALGTLGIGYATWSENVTIEQTVRTGDLKVGVANIMTNDSGIGQHDPGYDKDVARCTSQNVSPVLFSIGPYDFYEKVTEVITNAYPCYSCNITFKFASGGSIPVHFKDWSTELVENDGGLCYCVDLKGWWLSGPAKFTTLPAQGTSMCGLESALRELQLHENDIITLKIEKHLKQDCWDPVAMEMFEAPQSANCTMVHRAKWVQFNKVDED